MTPATDEDTMPVIVLSDRQAAALAAYQAGVRDAHLDLPALVDPQHHHLRWDWLDGWLDGQRHRNHA